MQTRFIFLTILFLIKTGSAQDHSGHGTSKLPKPAVSTATPKLEPKKEEARVAVDVPENQQAKLGLKTSKAEKKKVNHIIRTVGTVTADQTKEAHVHTKINGWIEIIYADYIGKAVKKGQPLFELYSPELVSTQQEFLAARKQGSVAREISDAALERLQLWNVPKKEIERLKREGKIKRTVTFDSPVDGFVVNKTAIQGMYVTPEMELYHIADLSRVWIIVTLYEYDISTVNVGDTAEIKLPYDPSKTVSGKINYIYPEIEIETRTAKARLEIDNTDQKLKPGMFANIELKKDLGEAIVIPDEAVINTGTRNIVFVKISPSRFEPREVKIGPRLENLQVIASGLKDREEVVTTAHFMIDAESKLQAALQKGGTQPAGHGTHGGK